MSLQLRRQAYRYATKADIQKYVALFHNGHAPAELQEQDYLMFIRFACLPPQRRKDMWCQAIHKKKEHDIQFRTYVQELYRQGFHTPFEYSDYDFYVNLCQAVEQQKKLLFCPQVHALLVARAAAEQQVEEQLRLDGLHELHGFTVVKPEKEEKPSNIVTFQVLYNVVRLHPDEVTLNNMCDCGR